MAETQQERAEAARVRRRWLTLGEVVAILAVMISGLTLWNSWRERTNAEAEKATEARATRHKAGVLLLKGTPDKNGHTLDLVPMSDAQAIQSQSVHFPSPLKLDPADTSGDARIERGWFDAALVEAREDAKLPDRPGDSRMPVLIETRYLADGEPRVDRSIYDLGYATHGMLLRGTAVELRGISRVGGADSLAAGRKRIDALWAARLKAK